MVQFTSCLTCRSKKVKCDEESPRCLRCQRLRLRCDWAKQGGKSRTPARYRNRHRTLLPQLSPKVARDSIAIRDAVDDISKTFTFALGNEIPEASSSSQPTRRHEATARQAFDPFPFLASYASYPDLFPILGDCDLESAFDIDCLDFSTAHDIEAESASAAAAKPLLCHESLLPVNFVRTGKEVDALRYYTSVYPTMTISKDVHWSSYRIMLDHGSQVPMTMHLLIAASLMDLATSQNYDEAMCRAAQAHANAGVLLLMSASESGSGSNPSDVITAFYFLYRYIGYGGSLALHWCAESQRSREIYQQSGVELESMFGDDYPEREIIDDVQNAPIVTFFYDVMTLYAEVNRVAYTLPDSNTEKAALEDKFDRFEARSRSLIRLTTITSHPRSRVMLNADYMVPFYYALRIYSFLCFLPEDSLGVPTPPLIQSFVSSTLTLAQRSLSSGTLDPMRARFQWPLFVAGIETADCIHREWVQSKLKSGRMSQAFQRIVSTREETGIRLPMSAVRQILAGKASTAL
ncbi:uncharacterized protein LMH87_007998 [Akanthomyces muscarius]|uniref:Zn(2)-C6 fungal-type domain-containing protein n=1 Tax=Akanthomyces muscarius TaxID=2231603 RepID=A0A9W8QKC4_AKAMU|nr:uncharacterized protein LMH87_007998 [Akanthomyces muscarius]KAJ4160068.1 hypothetical protein LMH87_007998 [Akanthomyces muscarius]